MQHHSESAYQLPAPSLLDRYPSTIHIQNPTGNESLASAWRTRSGKWSKRMSSIRHRMSRRISNTARCVCIKHPQSRESETIEHCIGIISGLVQRMPSFLQTLNVQAAHPPISKVGVILFPLSLPRHWMRRPIGMANDCTNSPSVSTPSDFEGIR